MRAFEMGEDSFRFLAGEHSRQALRFTSAFNVRDVLEIDLQYVAIEKEEGAKCDGLSRCSDTAIHGEMRNELANLILTHIARVAFVMKEDEYFDPGNVGLLSPQAKMADATDTAAFIKQAGHQNKLTWCCKERFLHQGGADFAFIIFDLRFVIW